MSIKKILDSKLESPFTLLGLALLASLFFSITFILNKAISLDGGHWFWSGALRFFFAFIFLAFGFIVFKGLNYFKAVMREFIDNLQFWIITGTLGFGIFYSLICYAADFAPAWVVATTWQLTIIASLFVLSFFGQKLSKKIWFFTFLVFIGITFVNLSHVSSSNLDEILLGFFPVLVAAISYPIGNQMVWQEKKKRNQNNPEEKQVINNAFAKVFLMTLGSFPLWIILFFTTDHGMFTQNQVINVAIISLLSGVIASSLFLYARSKANTSLKLILIDVSASAEVIFALLGEVILLNVLLPNGLGFIGIIITIISIIFIAKSKS